MIKKEVGEEYSKDVRKEIVFYMNTKSVHTALKTLAFIGIVLLFCYFRVKPLHFQTVGYTYDQGRDFLKAAEIVLYRNLTFIGPTTGIMGLYHGAWWFYVLTIPFALFRGLPIGFYYFNFAVQLLSFLALGYILYRRVGKLSSILAMALIAISPYFLFTSAFVGNNIMVLPSLLSLILTTFLYFEKPNAKHLRLLFLMGLSLGFVAEFELAFGLFIIPTFLLSIAVFPQLRQIVRDLRASLAFFCGLLIPFIPRLLFEVKHNFDQTRVLLSFFLKPKLHNPKLYIDVFHDRLTLFISYYKSIFTADWIAWLFLAAVVGFLVYRYRTKSWRYARQIVFFAWLLLMLLLFSTVYKDNFWGNYYEGIQYLMLFLGILVMTPGTRRRHPIVGYVKIVFILLILFTAVSTFAREWGKQPVVDGMVLRDMQAAVTYVTDRERAKDYCVRVYTPPVIPYTYEYLFLRHRIVSGSNMPGTDWVDNRCWFILENDTYKKRRDDWIQQNIPADYKRVSSKRLKGATVELWHK